MLHHGSHGNGGHDQNGGHIKPGDRAGEVGEEGLQADRSGSRHGGKVHQGDHRAGGVHCCGPQGIGGHSHQIGDHHAQKDGDDLNHTLPPDVGCDDDRDGQEGQPPAGGGVAYRVRGQVEADEDDDGPGDHRRQEAHDLLYADQFDDGGQNHIEQAGHYNAAAGILELDGGLHCGIGAGIQGGHGGEAAQIGERGAQKGGYLQAGANMEEEGADAGEKQSGLDGQGQAVALDQNGDQDGGAEHGEQVLEAQHQHLGQAKRPGVIDGLASGGGFVTHTCLLSRLGIGQKKSNCFFFEKAIALEKWNGDTQVKPKKHPVLHVPFLLPPPNFTL